MRYLPDAPRYCQPRLDEQPRDTEVPSVIVSLRAAAWRVGFNSRWERPESAILRFLRIVQHVRRIAMLLS
jgi:hypothetical protein